MGIELEPRSTYRIKFSSNKVLENMTFYTDYYVANKATVWLSEKCHLLPHEYNSLDNFPVYEDFAKTINIPEYIGRHSGELCLMVFANSDMKHEYHIQVKDSDVPAPTIPPVQTPAPTPTTIVDPSDNQGGDGKKDDKMSKSELILIIVASVLGALAIAAIVTIVIVCVKMKKNNDPRIMRSDKTSEALNAPLF